MHAFISVEACICVVLFYIFGFYVEILCLCTANFEFKYISMYVCVFQVYSVFLMQFVQCTPVIVCTHADMYTVSICRAI